ncbi:hypothetical protein P152DRAFT_447208 [Eremomyces bilateralis CBS 781.70]|uniref:Uncharacterized protein n=1 Tax=Eremomyces bilateralis CBS 781.70 TaxID=1392243 RepID=A0A6G1GAI5_9PEZI|nr:uncharacterized protein P152DRAFT_447208 [Eremomyces bilateralis CBS 781.70]KAF1814921.1 hypothetical protein P152DRAFT_447208 [Eremomyces bilateralis CBS 781.70]
MALSNLHAPLARGVLLDGYIQYRSKADGYWESRYEARVSEVRAAIDHRTSSAAPEAPAPDATEAPSLPSDSDVDSDDKPAVTAAPAFAEKPAVAAPSSTSAPPQPDTTPPASPSSSPTAFPQAISSSIVKLDPLSDSTSLSSAPTNPILPTTSLQTSVIDPVSMPSSAVNQPPSEMPGGLSPSVKQAAIIAGVVSAILAIFFLCFIIWRFRHGATLRTVFQKECPEKQAPSRPPSDALAPWRLIPRARSSWHSLRRTTRNWSVPAYAWDRRGAWERSQGRQTPEGSFDRLGELPRPYPAAKIPGRTTARPLLPTPDSSTFFDDRSTIGHALDPSAVLAAIHTDENSTKAPPPNRSSSPVLPSALPDSSTTDAGHETRYSSTLSTSTIPPPPPFKASRFSWTNSQAPTTPRLHLIPSPTADHRTHAELRKSTASERARDRKSRESKFSETSSLSSAPRYRTVDSWVGNQTTRVASQIRAGMPTTPTTPTSATPDNPNPFTDAHALPFPPPVPKSPRKRTGEPQVPDVPDRYRRTGARRPDTTVSEATVFRQHPGTEVVIPRGSLVPSEMLDVKVSAL